MRTMLAAAGLTLGLVAGCSAAPDQPRPSTAPSSASPSPSATSSPSAASSASDSTLPAVPATSELAHDPSAAAEVRGAVRTLIEKNTGKYRLSVDLGDGAGILEQGVYQLQPRAFAMTRALSDPSGSVMFEFRGVGDRTWLRLTKPPLASQDPWPCWVALDDLARVSGASDLDVGLAADQPPAALIAASYGVGREPAARPAALGNVLGTTDLVSALQLLDSRVVAKTGIEPTSTALVSTYFDVRGPLLHGFTIGLRGLFAAIEQAGGVSPADPSGAVPGTIEATFKAQGYPVRVAAPDAGAVVAVPAGGDADLADLMATCGGGRPAAG